MRRFNSSAKFYPDAFPEEADAPRDGSKMQTLGEDISIPTTSSLVSRFSMIFSGNINSASPQFLLDYTDELVAFDKKYSDIQNTKTTTRRYRSTNSPTFLNILSLSSQTSWARGISTFSSEA